MIRQGLACLLAIHNGYPYPYAQASNCKPRGAVVVAILNHGTEFIGSIFSPRDGVFYVNACRPEDAVRDEIMAGGTVTERSRISPSSLGTLKVAKPTVNSNERLKSAVDGDISAFFVTVGSNSLQFFCKGVFGYLERP